MYLKCHLQNLDQMLHHPPDFQADMCCSVLGATNESLTEALDFVEDDIPLDSPFDAWGARA